MTDRNVLPIIGRGMAQAVSYQTLTAKAQVCT
jgi:hypothetical protein